MISPAALLFPGPAAVSAPGSLPAAPEQKPGLFAGLLPEQPTETPALLPDPEALAASEALAAGLEAEIAARLEAEPLPLSPPPQAMPLPVPLPEETISAGAAPEASPDLPPSDLAPSKGEEQAAEPVPVLAAPAPLALVVPSPLPDPSPALTGGAADPAPHSAAAAPLPASAPKPLPEPAEPGARAPRSAAPSEMLPQEMLLTEAAAPAEYASALAPPRKSAPSGASLPVTAAPASAASAAAGAAPLPESGSLQGEVFALQPLPEPGPQRSETAQPAAPAAAPQTAGTASPLLRNVMERLEQIEQSEGRTRLLLRPQGLGILEIEISRLTDGRLQMAIRAENPMILQSLQQEATALNDFLGARGFDMAGGGPDLGRYSRPETGSAGDEAKEADNTAAEPPETPARRDQHGPGLIDITT